MAKSLDIIDPKKELAPRDEREDNEEEEEGPRQERSGGGVFYLILGIIAVVVSTSLAVYILFKDNKDDAKTTSPSASATVSPTATTSTTATASATTSVTATTSAAATTFKYTDESIRIVNGNGKSGEASRIKASLEAKGYAIASTGNASKSYDKTTILYKAGEQALAEALKSAIAADYAATVQLSDQATLGSYDAVIALGTE